MYIPNFLHAKKSHDTRIEFILSYITIFNICFSGIYLLTIVYDMIRVNHPYTGFSVWFGCIVCLCFVCAYVAHTKKYIELSINITSVTIVSVCTLSGIRWGFDMPFTLLGYTLSIVIMSMIGNRQQNIFHLFGIVCVIVLGQIYRNNTPILETWHGTIFGFTDVFEVLVIFITIAALLIFSHRAEQNLLDRAKRTEYLLRKERDMLEERVEEKVSELKRMQIEHLSHMYRFVEFGKISSGLFHDLMSPVQTLKLYMESFPTDARDVQLYMHIKHMQSVSLKIETMLEAMRKQIRFNQHVESFDILEEIRDILLITKHMYIPRRISIDIQCKTPTYRIRTKKIILNHILLNLISNACEACLPTQENAITIHVDAIQHNQYKTYISIVDTGIGIPKHALEHIFDNFYSTKEKTVNCGIGLSSSKYTLEKHLHGKLLVESEEHVGTTMTILLPTPYISTSSITTGSSGLS